MTTANIFNNGFELDFIYSFQTINDNRILLPRRAVMYKIFKRFLTETVHYTMGDVLSTTINGKYIDLTRAYLKISENIVVRESLPDKYIMLVREIYYSHRSLLYHDIFYHDKVYTMYQKGYIDNPNDELDYNNIVYFVVEALNKNSILTLRELMQIVNDQWNNERNGNIVRYADGTFHVDKSFQFVDTFINPSSDSDKHDMTCHTGLSNASPKLTPLSALSASSNDNNASSRYITFFDRHYSMKNIQQLPSGSYIPFNAFVDALCSYICDNLPSMFIIDAKYKLNIEVTHMDNVYDLSNDYKYVISEYKPKQPLSDDLIYIVMMSHKYISIYPNITEESLIDIVCDNIKNIINVNSINKDDVNHCIKYSLNAYRSNPKVTVFDMIQTVNENWNETRDDVIKFSEYDYVVDENIDVLSNDVVWKTLKYYME